MIVLGVLLFVFLVVTAGFVTWTLCLHLHGKKENTRKDKREDIELVEEKNAVNVSRENRTPLYSELCSVTSVESDYQGLQRISVFYENSDVAQMKKKEEHEAYEEIGKVRRFISYVNNSTCL